MRLFNLGLIALLSLATTANASLLSLMSDLRGATGGIAQSCPTTYEQSSCLRVDGTMISVVGKIEAGLPGLIPGSWRDGPEAGLSADIPGEARVIHLVPRGEGQTLLVVQGVAAKAPPVTLPPSTEVTVENPQGAYYVILDARSAPVRDLSSVRGGTYQLVVSGYGKATTRQALSVPATGLGRLRLPTLAPGAVAPGTGGLVLPSVPGYLFMVQTASGEVVLDLSTLKPGFYDVFSYRLDGTAGPMAITQRVESGLVSAIPLTAFNTSFPGMPSVPLAPVTQPAAPAAAPSSGSSGRCWVNGYTRKNGTYVSGYYRSC